MGLVELFYEGNWVGVLAWWIVRTFSVCIWLSLWVALLLVSLWLLLFFMVVIVGSSSSSSSSGSSSSSSSRSSRSSRSSSSRSSRSSSSSSCCCCCCCCCCSMLLLLLFLWNTSCRFFGERHWSFFSLFPRLVTSLFRGPTDGSIPTMAGVIATRRAEGNAKKHKWHNLKPHKGGAGKCSYDRGIDCI